MPILIDQILEEHGLAAAIKKWADDYCDSHDPNQTTFDFYQEVRSDRCAPWLLRSTKDSIPVATEQGETKGLLQGVEAIAGKIEILLNEIIGVGGMMPTAELMANLSGMSVRSFHRSLSDSDTSFRELMDRVRLERAKSELLQSEISVKELASELGYSGSNNFVRAFKRMTGMTPTEFRTAESR